MTGWPAKSLWADTSVHVPFRAVCWCANAVAANKRVTKGPIIVVVEDILMIAFQMAVVHARSRRAPTSISIPLNVRRFPRDFLDNRPPVTLRRFWRTRVYSALDVHAPQGALGDDLQC